MTDYIESWKCQLCNELMYNVEWRDGKKYPAPGAPAANFISPELYRVCDVCFFMDNLLRDRRYFVDLEAGKAREVKRLTQNN